MSAHQRAGDLESPDAEGRWHLSQFAQNQPMFRLMVRSVVCLGVDTPTDVVAIAVLP